MKWLTTSVCVSGPHSLTQAWSSLRRRACLPTHNVLPSAKLARHYRRNYCRFPFRSLPLPRLGLGRSIIVGKPPATTIGGGPFLTVPSAAWLPRRAFSGNPDRSESMASLSERYWCQRFILCQPHPQAGCKVGKWSRHAPWRRQCFHWATHAPPRPAGQVALW